MINLEDEFLFVLQNIEAIIASVYREHPDLADFQVDSALEALGRTYFGEATGKAPVLPKSPMAQQVYTAVKGVCDWRMGRADMVDETGQPLSQDDVVTREDILACLKRIRKSVKLWNKEGGSQGYLNYIRQFLG